MKTIKEFIESLPYALEYKEGIEMDTWKGTIYNGDRYVFDYTLCLPEDNWKQYDTDQDDWYFGVWLNAKMNLLVTYAEGDISVCHYKTAEKRAFINARLKEAYPIHPPAAVVYSSDGERIKVYDERPLFLEV